MSLQPLIICISQRSGGGGEIFWIGSRGKEEGEVLSSLSLSPANVHLRSSTKFP